MQSLDMMKCLYEADKTTFSMVYPELPNYYLSLNSDLCPLHNDSSWDEVAGTLGWAGDGEDVEWLDDDFGPSLAHKKWYVGFAGLMLLVNAVHRGHFETKQAFDWKSIENTVQAFGKLVAPSTQATASKWVDKWATYDETHYKLFQSFLSASECWKNARFEFGQFSKKSVWTPIDQDRRFGPGTRMYYGWVNRDVMLLVGCGIFQDRAIVISRNHVNLLVESLYRIANIHMYLATQYATNSDARYRITTMLNFTLDKMYNANPRAMPKVCKALHKMRAMAQMRLLENENEGAEEGEVRDYIAGLLHHVVPIEEYHAIVEGCPNDYVLDVLHTYKWIPPPDYDATLIFPQVSSWHLNRRKSGADHGSSAALRGYWERVIQERKMNIACAYHAMNREWPEALEVRGRSPTLEALARWDPAGLFPYHQYGADIASQIKDKTTVADTKDRELYKSVQRSSSSFLYWYMTESEGFNTITAIDDYARGNFPEENYVRVAYKPEAHKPDSRLFYMAPPRQRILLGELEGNLSRIAEYYPGSLQGKTSSDKARMIQSIMTPFESPRGAPGGCTNYIIMFDLSKFSPKFNENVLANYHKFWARVFGVPGIEQLYKIGPESTILHTTANLHMEYKNGGADLEGFRGRLMTMFHADMLGAACRLARERGYLASLGELAVFIDDGVVKIAVDAVGAEATAMVNGFLHCMQDIYAGAGQENHPSKTCCSRLGGEILAEFYIGSVRLPAPIKSAMRLYPAYDNPAGAITEDFDALFSTSQGCVKDGGGWLPTYYRFIYSKVLTLHRWARLEASTHPSAELAFKLMIPKSMGGFGTPPLQALVTTAGVNLTAEGLGMINRVCRAYPEWRGYANKVLGQTVIQRPLVAMMRDPTRVRLDAPVIVESRLVMLIVDWLENQAFRAHTLITAFRDQSLLEHAQRVAEVLFSTRTISLPLIERTWKATPLCYVETVVGKFKRAESILSMIGQAGLRAVRKRNQADVKKVLSNTF